MRGGQVSLNTFYLLNGKEIVPTESIEEWGEARKNFEENHRIGYTVINSDGSIEECEPKSDKEEVCVVSTVFLGIDHGWGRRYKPVLFETMVFNSPSGDDEMRRYCTFDEAEAGHREIVESIKARLLEVT